MLFALLSENKVDVKVKAVFDLDDIQEANRTWAEPGSGIGSMLISVGAT